MVATYLDAVTPRTPTVTTDQGGVAYEAGVWQRLNRFLVIGSDHGSYYASGQKLTVENVDVVKQALAEDWQRALAMIVRVSEGGLAPKQDPQVLALAIAAKDSRLEVRQEALMVALPKVCRYGTTLFHFVAYLKALNGGKWRVGRLFRRAIKNWYETKAVRPGVMTGLPLAWEVEKYKSRDGFSHRDLLIMAHPKFDDLATNAVARWVVHGELPESWEDDHISSYLHACRFASTDAPPRGVLQPGGSISPSDDRDIARTKLIESIAAHRLHREVINTAWLDDPQVWEALLQDMPIEAMIRNLAKMTSIGLLSSSSNRTKGIGGAPDAVRLVTERLRDKDRLVRGRVHPLKVLSALRVYSEGAGDLGSLRWTPVREIIDALDDAFYLSFQAVEPMGQGVVIALDVSGSMSARSTMRGFTAYDLAAVMGMVHVETEANPHIIAFSNRLHSIHLKKGMRLQDAIRVVQSFSGGGTDLSIPLRYAANHGQAFPGDRVRAVVTYTDNQNGEYTYPNHLRSARGLNGLTMKNVVAAMTAERYSVNDPKDPDGLDVVGFSTDAPSVIASFVRGGFA